MSDLVDDPLSRLQSVSLVDTSSIAHTYEPDDDLSTLTHTYSDGGGEAS